MKEIIYSKNAPDPVGPYSQAVYANGTLYVSGQIAIDPSTGRLSTLCIEDETHQVLKNLGEVLKANDMSYDNVVKCSVFIKDMHQYADINTVYSEYFDEATAPARALVEVAKLPKDVNIEISCIAVK